MGSIEPFIRSMSPNSAATYRADRLETVNPGLRAWAESWCPFGAYHMRRLCSRACGAAGPLPKMRRHAASTPTNHRSPLTALLACGTLGADGVPGVPGVVGVDQR